MRIVFQMFHKLMSFLSCLRLILVYFGNGRKSEWSEQMKYCADPFSSFVQFKFCLQLKHHDFSRLLIRSSRLSQSSDFMSNDENMATWLNSNWVTLSLFFWLSRRFEERNDESGRGNGKVNASKKKMQK